jgi:outer membrane protein assembly factor BamA
MKRGFVFIWLFLAVYLLYCGILKPRKAEAGYEHYGKSRYSHTSGSQKKVEFTPRVIFSYSKETNLVLGAALKLNLHLEPEKRASSVSFAATYSLNRQLNFWFTPVIYWKKEEIKLLGNIAYFGGLNAFYGIGNNTSRSDIESYTSRNFDFWGSLSKRIYSNLYAGLGYQYKNTTITKMEEGKLLAGGTIPGSEGGRISGIGLFTAWDARNNKVFPEKGGYHQFNSRFYGDDLNSDYMFNSFLVDLRYYQPLFSSHVLAFQAASGIIAGGPPFQELNSLGKYLRGYAGNRFMDKHFAVFQTEYRLPLFRRLGFVGFAGVGQVAGTCRDVSFRELKPAGGIGLRVGVFPKERLKLRIDLGFGMDEVNLDLGVGEAF